MANEEKPRVAVLGKVHYLSDEYIENVKTELNLHVGGHFINQLIQFILQITYMYCYLVP
jgi:hypothetical protein